MKTFLAIIGLSLAVLTASAQFVPGPTLQRTVNLSTPLTIVGSSTSNLVTASVSSPFTIGALGFGVTVNIAGTNAATTTNSLIRFDVSGDGVNWIANAVTVNYTPSATAWTPTYTNVLATGANLGNLSLARIASIQNTNLASIFVTNITITTR